MIKQIKIHSCRIIILNILIVLTFVYLFSCSGSKPVVKSLWYNKDINFDIRSSEIQKTKLFLDAKSKILYNVYNDKINLYLCALAGENQVQTKILRAGLQIIIDTSGKAETKSKVVCLTYPLIDEDETGNIQPELRSGGKHDWKARRSEFLLSHTDMKLSGFKSPINDMLPLKNNYGINVSVDWDSINNMYYLVKLPFKTFYKDSLSATDSSKVFTISIISNGLPRPDFSKRMNNEDNTGEMPGGMEGGGRGGMHGGGRGSFGGGHYGGGHRQNGGNEGSSSRENLFETNKIVVNFKLATHK